MVKLSIFLLKTAGKLPRAHFRAGFMDTLRITVHGGHGGNGVAKYGGVGGQGGCVCFVARKDVTLQKVAQKIKQKHISASDGEDGSKLRILGKRGLDMTIEVPVGVQVIGDNGEVIADLNTENAQCVAASGGQGGSSGTNFIGAPGENRTVNLDLKLIADVGLVGFPNAGKSTLLQSISNAKPKIAAYPFTTIRPQLGTIRYPDHRVIQMADLPGLIEGAHYNYGMGHNFLKHIERTRLLLFMVDIFGFRLSPKHAHRNCLENIYALNKELELYNPDLLEKPSVLLVNKMDVAGSENIYKHIKTTIRDLELGLQDCPDDLRPSKLIKFEKIMFISAKNTVKINRLRDDLRTILDKLAAQILVPDDKEVHSLLKLKLDERGPKIT